MSKFKIGDRVKIIDDGGSTKAEGRIGDIGTVVGLNSHDSLTYVRMADDEIIQMYAYRFQPAITTTPGKFYRTASGAVTGRVTNGDTGFEAVVDGKVRIFDAAGGAVHGGDDIVEEWAPRVGERVRISSPRHDFKQGHKGLEFIVSEQQGRDDGEAVWIGHPESRPYVWRTSELEPLPVAAEAQPAAQEPALVIEAGRYYRTRDGRKVGPLVETGNNEYWPFKWPEKTMYYKADGYSCPGSAHQHRDQDDLIAEWVDEPVATPTARVSTQVDAIAEEYGPAPANDNAQSAITVSISLDTGNMHEELDELIAKLKKVRKLQRQVGLAA